MKWRLHPEMQSIMSYSLFSVVCQVQSQHSLQLFFFLIFFCKFSASTCVSCMTECEIMREYHRRIRRKEDKRGSAQPLSARENLLFAQRIISKQVISVPKKSDSCSTWNSREWMKPIECPDNMCTSIIFIFQSGSMLIKWLFSLMSFWSLINFNNLLIRLILVHDD